MEMKSRRSTLLTAIVAGIVGASLSHGLTAGSAHAEDDGQGVECKGGNECKAKGECGGPGWSCAGNNTCRGKGFVTVKSQAECDALIAKVKAGDKGKGKAKKKA